MNIILRIFLVSCTLLLNSLHLRAQSPCSFTLEQGPVVFENCLDVMNVAVIVNGGSGNFEYLWSDNSTVDSTLSIANPENSVYSCAVFDVDEQCVDVIAFDINIPSNIGGDVTIIGDTFACENSNRLLQALVIGGSGDFTFNWSNGDSTMFALVVPPFPDFVTLIVTDNVTGCDTALIQNITSINAPHAQFEIEDTLCPGEPIVIINLSDTTDCFDVIGYRWFLNTVEKSQDVVPDFYANDTGFTEIKLLILDSLCSDSTMQRIPIYPYAPIQSAVITQEDRFTEISLIFPDDAIADSCIVYWGDGDTTFAACELPDDRHYYDEYGRYEIDISYVSSVGCKITKTLEINAIPEIKVFFPKAFSPDGDGINDTFGPLSDELDKVDGTFNVYNRRGQIIFSSNEAGKVWDGTYKGEVAPEGMYHYSYVIRPIKGAETNFGTSKGYFMLIK